MQGVGPLPFLTITDNEPNHPTVGPSQRIVIVDESPPPRILSEIIPIPEETITEINTNFDIMLASRSVPHPSWKEIFHEGQNEILTAAQIVRRELGQRRQIFPLTSDIFNAFRITPLDKVKVVIIGQDPYHQLLQGGWPRAVGLSFSVREWDTIPSSLSNIYKEIKSKIPTFQIPAHGDLTIWARQGVLMLNMCLTVRQGEAGSHGDIWLGLIHRVLRAIAEKHPKAVFMLWGREAQKIQTLIGQKSLILTAAHPSGLSANRGFFGCDHFRKTNKHLVSIGEEPIDWNL